MIDWKLIKKDFDAEKIAENGNRFLIGNGYMGVRGTLDEFEKEQLVAVNLAGIYDRVGDAWREPLNAPNGFFAYLQVDGKELRLPEADAKEHTTELDYRHGVFKRHTCWSTARGDVTFESERFVSMDDVHLGIVRYKIKADFHADINFVTGIDADVWDINGPHYDEIMMCDEDILTADAVTHEKAEHVFAVTGMKADFPCERKSIKFYRKILKSFNFVTDINKEYVVEKVFAIYTTKDKEFGTQCAKDKAESALVSGYDELFKAHERKWDDIWSNSEVLIEGDDNAMETLNYSCYHLNSIAPRHTDSLSIAARGLSGQTYKGAVFWDTEMFMLDFFLMTDPQVARNLVRYRIDTLRGAKEKALSYGYSGAFYAWESQEGGFDACSDYNVTDVFTKRPMRTFFRDKQVHISAAVVYGIARYMELTGDDSVLSEGGAETIIECAKFYYSLLLKKVSGTYYEIHDVIGPDEYHERVNNNGYTNRMAKYTFEQAVKVIESVAELPDKTKQQLESKYDLDKIKADFKDAYEKLYIPKPDKHGVIEQFDGYFKLEDASVKQVRSRLLDPKEYWGGAYGIATHTQVIKQADVVTWLAMFPNDVKEDELLKNWQYYEPRTEHGSSLSACMYSLLACRCGIKEKAYPLFMKSASADIKGGGKEWAGLVYIGGTHPAAQGGAYMVALKGFAGISFENHQIKVNPNLPEGWKKMKFNICYEGKKYKVTIDEKKADIELEG